ncbi:hypothetical protein WJX77_000007 [Trebouxia sp. C0004]
MLHRHQIALTRQAQTPKTTAEWEKAREMALQFPTTCLTPTPFCGMKTLPGGLARFQITLLQTRTTKKGGSPELAPISSVHMQMPREYNKSVHHEEGSLGFLVNNLVKNWEKEASYKVKGRSGAQLYRRSTYNALVGETAYYSSKNTDFEESHSAFRDLMPGGFSWEATEVFSGLPVVTYKWRHWGKMTGTLRCHTGPHSPIEAPATGQTIQLHGMGIAHVTDEFKITKLEIYYDPNEIMAQMVGSSSVCPVMHSTKHEKTPQGKDKYKVPLENQLGESLQSKLTVSEDNAGKSLTSGSGAAKGHFDNAAA